MDFIANVNWNVNEEAKGIFKRHGRNFQKLISKKIFSTLLKKF